MAEERPTVEDRVLSQLARMEEKQEARMERLEERLQGEIKTLYGRMERLEERLQSEIKTLYGEIKTLHDVVERRFDGMEQRVVRLEGGFEQMDKRMANVEQLQRWAIGIMFTSWFTIIGLILAKIW